MPQETEPTFASEWLKDFHRMKMDFDWTRMCLSAAVRVTLQDGTHVFAAGIRPGPGAAFVSIDVYPPSPPKGMVPDHDGLPKTPTVLMTPIGGISKLELLREAPGARSLGFEARDEPEATA